MPFKTSALEYQGNQKLKSTQIQKQKTMKKNTQNSKPNLLIKNFKETPFACNQFSITIETPKEKKIILKLSEETKGCDIKPITNPVFVTHMQ